MPPTTERHQLLVATLFVLCACQVQGTQNYETEIKKAILKDQNYDRTVRPYINSQGAIQTFVAVHLRNYQIDEHQLSATINAWIYFGWHDPRLTWQPSDYGGTDMIYVYPWQVWLPDIQLLNGVSHMDWTYKYSPVGVVHDGHAFWFTPSTFRVPCHKELANWPYDRQNCTIVLSSWVLNKDHHEVVPAAYDGSLLDTEHMVKTDSHWRMTAAKGYLVNATYSESSDIVWHELHMELHVVRVSLLYAMSVVLPCVALAVHVMIVFWIPPTSSAKIPVATIHSVALIFFLLNLFWQMPPVGGYTVPKVVSFVSGGLALSAVSAVVAAVASNLVTRAQPPPAPLLAVFTGLAGTALLLGDLQRQLQGTRAPFAEDGVPVQDKEATAAMRRAEWRLVASGLDRGAALLQLAVFVFLGLACLT